jgi:phage tail-like protein
MAVIPRALTDPLPAFNFRITLIDTSGVVGMLLTAVSFITGGNFTECTGLDASLQVEDYIEGGENTYVHKFPTRVTYQNIVLKRGVTLSEDLWNWHYEFVQGKGHRRDGVIYLLHESFAPVKMWIFKNGLPVKWTGPAMNAGQSAVAVESIEIAHEGLELLSPGSVASIVGGAVADAIKK